MIEDWNWSYSYYTVIFWLGWLGSVVFPIFYGFTARFWVTPLGRHFFFYSVVPALFYTSGMIKNYVPEFPLDITIRYILLTVAAYVVWWRVWEYLKIWRAETKRRKNQLRLLEDVGSEKK